MRSTLPENVKIVVPSRNRASWLWNRTNHTLKYVAHLKPTVFVRDDDPQLNVYREYVAHYGSTLQLQPSEGCFGVSQAYDMLIDQAISSDYERLIILDDDMQFKMWNPIIGAKPDVRRMSDDELTTALNRFAKLLCPEMPAVCMLPIARRTQPALLKFSAPLMWCYGFYLPHFKKHPEHRFYQGREIEARCDLNLALMLLTNGWLTAYDNTIIIPNEVNNPGGCSSYRKLEVEEASTDYLLAKYPYLVKQIISIGWGPELPDVRRRSVQVFWKRAFCAEKFYARFGVHASTFKLAKLREHERTYSAFVEDIRGT